MVWFVGTLQNTSFTNEEGRHKKGGISSILLQ